MTTQRDNVGGYFVSSDNSRYLVELRRLVNTYAGNPRYEATIFNLEKCDIMDYTAGHVFRFTGHHYSEQDEARWIIKHWEAKVEKMRNN